MSSARVVEALDEVEDGHLGLGLRSVSGRIEKLALQRREEALAQRIIVCVAIDQPTTRRLQASSTTAR